MINITWHHLEADPTIQSYIEEKILALQKYSVQFVEIHCIVERDMHHKTGPVYQFEAIIHVPGKQIQSKQSAATALAAVDLVQAELSEQIRKMKDQQKTKEKKQGKKIKEVLRNEPEQIDEII